MNRKTSIIICVTCIAIIIISLLGITYGFYMSKVFGNETAKSVVVTTADSKVTFRDLSDANETYSLEVGESFTKTFTVENTGQGSADYYVALTNVTNNFNRKEDVRYTLYRVGYNNGETELDFPEILSECTTKANDTFTTSCTIVENDAEYPSFNSSISQKEVLPSTGNIYKYLLVVTYINQKDINQDLDKGKTIAGRVQINSSESLDNLNPYNYNTSLLSYNIINNAQSKTNVDYNKTVFISPSEQDGVNYSIPAQQASLDNERILTYTYDNYGTSFYYRGNVEDNFVTFSGMCWRIVRIEGNGTIKLVLADEYHECSENTESNEDGTFSGYSTLNENSSVIGLKYGASALGFQNNESDFSLYKDDLEKWLYGGTINNYVFENRIDMNDITTKLVKSNYCQDFSWYQEPVGYEIDGIYNWEIRAKNNPSLKCNFVGLNNSKSKEINSIIGLLSVEEYVFAGESYNEEDESYYLLTNANNGGSNASYISVTMSPTYDYGDLALAARDSFGANPGFFYDIYFRPTIVINKNVTLTRGNGTQTDPYVID